MKKFWKELPKPFFVLAPMADVTDATFREFITHTGKPDVLYTEFVACAGLRSDAGRRALLKTLYYTEKQRPIVAQVFGTEPEDFWWCARLVRELGFDGVDVNMGCPEKNIVAQGAGAALIKDAGRARAIIAALKDGAGELPVSVKTRIGYERIDTERWIGEVLAEKPDALIVHLRTKKEMSKVSAHWEEMPKIVSMAHDAGVIVVGNGDVRSREEGERRARETGCDGIMIGRGVFGNPFVFCEAQETKNACVGAPMGMQKNDIESICATHDAKYRIRETRLRALVGLVLMFDEVWGKTKNYDMLKKHYAAYVRGFSGAKALRMQLMETKTAREALEMLKRSIIK